ncbi:hypothetical protein T484DRAFT_1764705 [Baffinella frigidus]|nr:hypothetical protein T484DRAFT_1764705 [Cryptophyta sp. CCMP2293]
MAVPVQGIVASSTQLMGGEDTFGTNHQDAPWKTRGTPIDFMVPRTPNQGRIGSKEEAQTILSATSAALDENRMTPFMALGTGPTTTLQDMISAARFNAHDPSKAFPEATEEEQNEIAMLQEQNLELMERLRASRRMRLLAKRDHEDLHEHSAEFVAPSRRLHNRRWTVEGWGLRMQHRDEVVVQCENRENVHIRKCNGVGHPVLIRIEGLCHHLCVEECSNVVIESSKMSLIIGSEVPNMLLRHVRGVDLTLSPDNMDGTIDTICSSSVRVHSVTS